MKQSEINDQAKRQRFEKPGDPVTAGDALAGDQYLRPEWADRIASGDSTLAKLARAHKTFRDGHLALRQAFESKDPTLTDDAHFVATRTLGEKWLNNAAASSDRAREAAETELKLTRAQLESDLGIVESHRANEIRAMLRGLPDTKRNKLLQDVVASKDAETLAAITSGPTYLSGLTADQVTGLRRQFERTHGGDALARMDAIEAAIAVNRQTALDAMLFAEKLLPSQRAAEIAAKQKAAREMRDKMSAEQ